MRFNAVRTAAGARSQVPGVIENAPSGAPRTATLASGKSPMRSASDSQVLFSDRFGSNGFDSGMKKLAAHLANAGARLSAIPSSSDTHVGRPAHRLSRRNDGERWLRCDQG